MDLQRVIDRQFADVEASYGCTDTILYALGTGFGTDPLDQNHLKFLYESKLRASPTMANILGHCGMWSRDPEYAIDWRRLLHGEQRLTMHDLLHPAGRIVAKHAIVGVRDQGAGAGARLYQGKDLLDADTSAPIASTLTTLVLRGDGGCGDYGDEPEPLHPLPTNSPDHTTHVSTLELAALIYRLSGDLNPLHADPAIAQQAGFQRPILHGLATMGFACYVTLREFCGFDPSALKSIALRFTRTVLPGDTIRFDFWNSDPQTLRFRATVDNRNELVIDRGTVALA